MLAYGRLQKEEVEECIWAVAGREGVQHADNDVGWRLLGSGLGLGKGSTGGRV